MNETPRKVVVFETKEQVALAAADRFVSYARESIAERDHFSVALAGGNTPRRVYQLLASDPHKNLIEWSRVHFFFGDERCVPPEHPESNYGVVDKILFSPIAIPSSNIHRMLGEGDPEESAAAYERDLRTFFGEVSWPRFDLVLLGMGEDGHTASLFPHSEGLTEKATWVIPTKIVHSEQDRISLSLPALNNARHVIFLVTGSGKAQRISEVLRNRPRTDPDALPAQLIAPVDGILEWLIDRPAAAQL